MSTKSLIQVAEGPVLVKPSTPHFVVEPSHGWLSLRLQDLWAYRELLYFLVWRDVKVRYKQTALGAAWAILQPLLTMGVFSVILGGFAGIPSDGIPYPIFIFAALLPWQLFAFALTTAGFSLVVNQELITKVYFPRLIAPLAAVSVGLVDFAISFVILLGMMVYFQIPLTWAVCLLPLFVLLTLATALAIGLWLAALNTRYRDIQYTIPFLTQLGLFVTPVAYPSSLIPEQWRFFYGLNPMVSVVEGFRWALLDPTRPLHLSFFVSIITVGILLVGGLIFFARMERTFADYI